MYAKANTAWPIKTIFTKTCMLGQILMDLENEPLFN